MVDTHQKTGAIKNNELKSLKDKAKDGLKIIKRLEAKLIKEGRLKTYKINNAIIQTTFTKENSPLINHLNDGKAITEEIKNIEL